jgi:hypothetical protein
MSNVVIDIAAEFTGKKAFKQADTAAQKLTKTVGNLAKGFGIAFSARALAQYSKQAVLAFAADDKAARVLSRTLDNLGLAFANPAVKTFISDLEKQYGILDDFLRPAYQKLVTTTGDWRKSQELLKTALDLSAQSGVDVVSVTDDIARAYAGNTKGLQKYGLGLSKTQLSAMSFEEVLARITKISSGQAALAADTYSGKLDKLNVAAANASETIGGALVDAFVSLAGDGNIDKATGKIDLLAQSLATLISPKRMADLFAGVDLKYGFIPINKTPNTSRSKSPAGTYARNQAEIKAAAAAKKQQADLLATNKKTLKSQQDALKLAKAKSIFDNQKIQIEAALKGKISEEDRIRLLLLKAIANENIDDIEKYTKMLNEVQGKVTELQATLEDVYAMDAGNPFVSWEIGLDGVQRALIQIGDDSIELTNTLAQNSLAMGLMGGASFAQALSGARYAAQAAAAAAAAGFTGTLGDLPPAGNTPVGNTSGNTTVTVNVAGTVTAQADLEKAIQDAINASNASGSANYLAPKTWRAEV